MVSFAGPILEKGLVQKGLPFLVTQVDLIIQN